MTFPNKQAGTRHRRRKHSDEFKADAVAACMQPGRSMVAMAQGINANLLRRWVNDAEMKPVARTAVATPARTPAPPQLTPVFVPMTVPTAARAPAPVPTQDIRIELRRNAMTVTVTWPASAAAECATWMRELLR